MAARWLAFGASLPVVGLIMLPTAIGTVLVVLFNRRLVQPARARFFLLAGTATVAAAVPLTQGWTSRTVPGRLRRIRTPGARRPFIVMEG